MNGKERVMAAVNLAEPDLVPGGLFLCNRGNTTNRHAAAKAMACYELTVLPSAHDQVAVQTFWKEMP